MILRALLITAAVIVLSFAEEPKTRYKDAALEVPINEAGSIELFTHWSDQAYSGLMAAFAAKTLPEVHPDVRADLTACSKQAKDSFKHAECVSKLLKHRQESGPYKPKKNEQKLSWQKAFEDSASPFVQTGDNLIPTSTDRIRSNRGPSAEKLRRVPTVPVIPPKQEDDSKWVGSFAVADEDEDDEAVHVPRVRRYASLKGELPRPVSRSGYNLASKDNNISPLGGVARMLLKSLVQSKNKTEATNWKYAIQRVRQANALRKKKEKEGKRPNNMPFDPESEIDMLQQVAYRFLGEKGGKLGDIDPENESDILKLANDEKFKKASDPMRKFLNMLRDGIKVGYSVMGKNTSNFDQKTLKIASPRFFSVVPEENTNNTENILSPSLFSLHSEGKGLEGLTSLPNMVKTFTDADQDEWLNLIIEAADIEKHAEEIEDEFSDDMAKKKKKYTDKMKGKDGQPMYFSKKNVTTLYGDHEGEKIETFEKLMGTYSKNQLRELNSTGFALLSPEQIEMIYGPNSPTNDSVAYEKLMNANLTQSNLHGMIEKDIHVLAELGNRRRSKRQAGIILSPLVFFPIIYAAPILSQAVILSPLVFSPIVGTPAVLGPIILSPWVFIPLILSPRVLSPLILSPMIFSPLVLSPLVLHPLILCPGIFNPIVLTPLVLSPLILSPEVFTPIVLSPLVLNPLILNPMVGSPLVLSPFVLSPLILSPQALFAVVLSPYALSPLILSPLAIAEVVLSPSWLS